MVDAFIPRNLKEAFQKLEFTDCTIFAGGTDLMVKKKQWAGLEPSFDKPVLFISQIGELKESWRNETHMSIGAACTFSQLMDSNLIPDYFKRVIKEIASPSIRNMATIGGNICNASPAGDILPLLYALDAILVVQSSCRRVEVPIQDFILGPGRSVLKSGELLVAVKLPLKDFNVVDYSKIGTRKSTALSKLSFIGLAALDDNGLHDIRIAFGAVAPTVVRNRELEEELISMFPTGLLNMQEIASSYDILIKPIDDQRSTAVYRKRSCNRLLMEFIRKIV